MKRKIFRRKNQDQRSKTENHCNFKALKMISDYFKRFI